MMRSAHRTTWSVSWTARGLLSGIAAGPQERKRIRGLQFGKGEVSKHFSDIASVAISSTPVAISKMETARLEESAPIIQNRW
jgi:hypothetical protein